MKLLLNFTIGQDIEETNRVVLLESFKYRKSVLIDDVPIVIKLFGINAPEKRKKVPCNMLDLQQPKVCMTSKQITELVNEEFPTPIVNSYCCSLTSKPTFDFQSLF